MYLFCIMYPAPYSFMLLIRVSFPPFASYPIFCAEGYVVKPHSYFIIQGCLYEEQMPGWWLLIIFPIFIIFVCHFFLFCANICQWTYYDDSDNSTAYMYSSTYYFLFLLLFLWISQLHKMMWKTLVFPCSTFSPLFPSPFQLSLSPNFNLGNS